MIYNFQYRLDTDIFAGLQRRDRMYYFFAVRRKCKKKKALALRASAFTLLSGDAGSRTRVRSAERVAYSMRSQSMRIRKCARRPTGTSLAIVLLFSHYRGTPHAATIH